MIKRHTELRLLSRKTKIVGKNKKISPSWYYGASWMVSEHPTSTGSQRFTKPSFDHIRLFLPFSKLLKVRSHSPLRWNLEPPVSETFPSQLPPPPPKNFPPSFHFSEMLRSKFSPFATPSLSSSTSQKLFPALLFWHYCSPYPTCFSFSGRSAFFNEAIVLSERKTYVCLCTPTHQTALNRQVTLWSNYEGRELYKMYTMRLFCAQTNQNPKCRNQKMNK